MIRKAQEIEEQLMRRRRDLHVDPALSFQETRVVAMVADAIASVGCRVQTHVGRTGAVGDIGHEDPVIAIRADMDVLPIQESNTEPHASRVPRVMHACGHDAHVACALGAARPWREETSTGTVRFLFQPAEEVERGADWSTSDDSRWTNGRRICLPRTPR
jgi:amidohydrolase